MKIFHSIILFTLMACLGLLSGCVDELPADPSDLGRGDAYVTAEVSFPSLNTALSRSVSGGTPGDAIKDINSVCVVIYDKAGAFVRKEYFDRASLVIDENTENPSDTPSSPSSNPGETGSTGHRAEAATKKATVKLAKLPYGYYRMYAIANVPDSRFTPENMATQEALKNITLDWQSGSVADNSQMFGYFSQDNTSKGYDAPLVAVGLPEVTLKAWVKRAASKVTIAFDARDLKENIYIYLKSAEIKDIPAHCLLGADNVPGSYKPEDSELNELIANGQTINYVANPASVDYNDSWEARISKGDPVYGFNTAVIGKGTIDEQIAAQHNENVNALYFYENMQGEGEAGTASDKWQVVEGDEVDKNNPKPSYPDGNTKPDPDKPETDPSITGFKDNKKYGTYIEVRAYYKSLNNGDISEGDIVYRFMLGKDTHLDYNAERNHHYKLTMHFNGYANDIDWHIDYKRDPGMKMPNPYFISYLYNHSMMFPLQIETEPGVIVTGLKAEIIENNWAPADPGSLDYWKTMNRPGVYPDGFSFNGFLSLHKREKTKVVAGPPYNLFVNQANYEETPHCGVRTYFEGESDIQDGEHQTEGALASDKFSVNVRKGGKNEGNTYHFQLPMYTRAKQLVKETAYTGNNPFVAYQRWAKVRFTATLFDTRTNSEVKPYVEDVTIKQSRRVVNPKGVWRKKNNKTKFNVVLKVLPNEEATSFVNLESTGPWKAYVIRDVNNIIYLSGNKETTSSKKETIKYQASDDDPVETINVTSIYGHTGSEDIDFDINFNDGEGDAIIRVEYNDFSCYHLIFVKKGDSPVDLGTGTKWYTKNMRSGTAFADNPCDEGSLFKWNNWTGIDALKNKNNKKYWINIEPDDFIKNAAGKDNSLTLDEWNSITTKGNKDSLNKIFSDPTVGNAVIATYEDYVALYKYKYIGQGFGVLYGDESDKTLDDIVDAYGYDYSNKTGGMRGCFIYNKETGANVFFPIGASGYGHRKEVLKRPKDKIVVNHDAGPYSKINPVTPASDVKLTDDNSDSYPGVLRYSSNSRWGWFNLAWGTTSYPQAVNDAPLFYDVYRRPGAIYWLQKEVDGRQDTEKYPEFKDESLARVTGWDFNYFTFDFYPIGETNMSNGHDAVFIRCVQK